MIQKKKEKLVLKLDDLRVQSFITTIDNDEQRKVRGGDQNCPDFATSGGGGGGGPVPIWDPKGVLWPA